MRGLLFDKLSHGLQNVLTLRQKQHAMTAANLANSETPGFKAKYLDFEKALVGAMDRNDGVGMQRTQAQHLRSQGMDRASIREVEADPWSSDGNSVNPEREQARLQHNSLMYRAVSEGLSRRMAMLKFAANDGS